MEKDTQNIGQATASNPKGQRRRPPARKQNNATSQKPEQGGRKRRPTAEIMEELATSSPGRNYPMVDIGLNLAHAQLNKKKEEVIDRAKRSGVVALILTGTSVKGSREVSNIAKMYPGYGFSTAGVHPHDAKSCNDNTIDSLRKLAELPHVVAIGETGLDFDRNFSPPDVQEKWFRAQVDLAIELDMPLFLHERAAFDKLFGIMKEYGDRFPKCVVHCFTGTREAMHAYLDFGCYIGITGWVCDERRGTDLYEIVKEIPLDRLLIETDAPFLTPRNLPGKDRIYTNEPCLLGYVAKTIAESYGVPIETICEASTVNALKLFNIEGKVDISPNKQ